MVPEPYDVTSGMYGDYNFEEFGYMKVPPPSKNGGLYVGEEFDENAEYADVKVLPDAFYLNNNTIKLQNKPPLGVENQVVNNNRQGNNNQILNPFEKVKSAGCYFKKNIKEIIPCAANSFDNTSSTL